MTDAARPTHLSPKPFLALEEARIALDAMENSMRTARVEIARLEKRAETLLLSDQDARDLLAEYALNRRARRDHCNKHGYSVEQPREIADEWSRIVDEGQRIEEKLLTIGNVLHDARERMAERIAEEAKRGAAA